MEWHSRGLIYVLALTEAMAGMWVSPAGVMLCTALGETLP